MALLAVLCVCRSVLLIGAVFRSHDFSSPSLHVLLSVMMDAFVASLLSTFVFVFGLHLLSLVLCNLAVVFCVCGALCVI